MTRHERKIGNELIQRLKLIGLFFKFSLIYKLYNVGNFWQGYISISNPFQYKIGTRNCTDYGTKLYPVFWSETEQNV